MCQNKFIIKDVVAFQTKSLEEDKACRCRRDHALTDIVQAARCRLTL